MAQRTSHDPPNLNAGMRATVDKEAHHLRVCLHGGIGIEVAGLKGAQLQPLRSDRRDLECRPLRASATRGHRRVLRMEAESVLKRPPATAAVTSALKKLSTISSSRHLRFRL